jgi:transposase InsO family protein
MSRKGNCWDNAVAESFFATLKKQCVHGQAIKPLAEMRQIVFEFIEIYYNRVRRHSANDWQTPVESERLFYQKRERSTVH